MYILITLLSPSPTRHRDFIESGRGFYILKQQNYLRLSRDSDRQNKNLNAFNEVFRIYLLLLLTNTLIDHGWTPSNLKSYKTQSFSCKETFKWNNKFGTTTNSHDVIVKTKISLIFSTKLSFISTTLSHTIQINSFEKLFSL